MHAARLFLLCCHIFLVAAPYGAASNDRVGGTGSGADLRPADTFSTRRHLHGAGRRGRAGWKSFKDADAVIRRSRQSGRSANGTSSARIAWGADLSEGRYPFAAYLYIDNSVCTGSLIAPRVILTAAHCVFRDGQWADTDNSAVFLGGVDVTEMEQYSIENAYIPSEYETVEGLYGDIAIIELADPADGIKPVAMATPNANLAKVTALVAVGWGETEEKELPDVARFAKLKFLSKSTCNALSRKLFGTGMAEDKVCFGLDRDPPFSVCGGDSGGPLIARNSKGPVVVAVTSYGVDYPCGDPDYNINMGTSVAHWREWVENMLSFYNLRGYSYPSKSNTLEDGQCYQGSVIASWKTSPWGCLEKCRASASCSAWSHEYDTGMCTLFRSADEYYEDENCTSGYFE